ncbi:MAG: hypothetical protein ABSB79_12010 [Syntrophales bacterium]
MDKLYLSESVQLIGFRQVYRDTPHISFLLHPNDLANQVYFAMLSKFN